MLIYNVRVEEEMSKLASVNVMLPFNLKIAGSRSAVVIDRAAP
jgi:hypothetical protein